MKRFTKFAMASAVGLSLASLAYSQPTTTDRPEPTQETPSGRTPGRGMAALINRVLDKYDSNKDGQLDKTEMEALRKDADDGKVQPPFAQRGGRGLAGPRVGQPDQDLQDRPNQRRPEAMRRDRSSEDVGPDRRGDRDGRPEFQPNARGSQAREGQGFGPQRNNNPGADDMNRDGRPGPREREGFRQDIHDGKAPLATRPPQTARGTAVHGRRGSDGDLRGPGQPGMPPSPRAIMRRFDVNRDGVLDERELAAFLQDLHQRRLGHENRRGVDGPGHPLPPGGPPQPEE